MFQNRISRTLHDEHCATIALMERLERLIRRRQAAAGQDPEVSKLLRELASSVEADALRHFDFEEGHLFTLFESVGDQLIGDHLTEEHTAMRPLALKLAEIARAAATGGFDTASWNEFRQLGSELVQRMVLHIQKEEMALLPLLDDTLDQETEARLFELYRGEANGP